MADTRRSSGRAQRSIGVLTGALLVLAACAKVAGIDALEIGECKGGICVSEGGDEGVGLPDSTPGPNEGGLDGGRPCPGTKGPVMIRVGTPTNNFCIDTTEVTVGQYAEFTSAVPDAAGQGAPCTWNTSYLPGAGSSDLAVPIAGIDWCDARAYCAFAGKRLCGKHKDGKHVGPVPLAENLDFNTNEWLLACSNVGQFRYPYGGIHQPLTCNTGEVEAGKSEAVKTKKDCEGGFKGVFDMVGNLWEWHDGPCLLPDAGGDAAGIDSGGGAKDECFVKGGSFTTAGPQLGCSSDGRGALRDRRATDVGFRCCSD